jgi:predicted N-acetyltransferase YhbS
MVTIRTEMPFDIDARENLLDRVWGPSRFQKTAERLREGREPSAGLSFVAEHDGDIVGTVRLWDITPAPAGRRCCSGRWRWTKPGAPGGSAAR